jgi:origin recognition complex subunit 1
LLLEAAGKPKRQKKAPGAVPKLTPNKRLRSGSRSLSPALAPSSDEDSGSEAEPFSSDEDDTSSSSGVSSDDDIGELPATTAGGGLKRKRAAAASTSKKTYGQGRAGGRLSAAERRAEKIKAAQYRKVKATVKRLKAPKARPMQDLPEAVRSSGSDRCVFPQNVLVDAELLLSSSTQPLPQDPYLRALHLLHVGATPDTLPCREEQYADVLVKIEGVIEGGGGGCVCAFT